MGTFKITCKMSNKRCLLLSDFPLDMTAKINVDSWCEITVPNRSLFFHLMIFKTRLLTCKTTRLVDVSNYNTTPYYNNPIVTVVFTTDIK